MLPVLGHSAIVHLLIMLLSLYCFTVFSYWWMKVRAATFLYSVTTILLFGIFLTHGGAFFAYLDLFADGKLAVINQWWWPCRGYPMLIALVIYAVNITKQVNTKI